MEIGADAFDVVERIRALRVTRELRDLPRREIREDAPGERLALVLEPFDFFADVELRVFADELQGVDSRLELRDRLFKFQELQIHISRTTSRPQTLPSTPAPHKYSRRRDDKRADNAGAAPLLHRR